MMRPSMLLLLALATAAPSLAIAARIELQPQSKNLASEQAEAGKFIDDLSRGKRVDAGPGRQVSYGEAPVVGAPYNGGPLDYKAAGKSPYQTNETLDAMTAMSIAALQSMGTPAQGASADRLSAYGSQLSQSGSPALSQAGGNLKDQAAAMNAGDKEGALGASQRLQNMSRSYLPSNYRPSAADMTWAGAMGSIGTDFMSSFASQAGATAMQLAGDALTRYFSKDKTAKNTAVGGLMANVGKDAGKGIVTGKNTPKSIASGVGSVAGYGGSKAGSAVMGGSASGSGGGNLPGKASAGTALPGSIAPSTGGSSPISAQGGGATGNVLPGASK